MKPVLRGVVWLGFLALLSLPVEGQRAAPEPDAQSSSRCPTTGAIDAKICYSAKGDLTWLGGCSIVSGSNTLRCGDAHFSAADAGKTAYVWRAGNASGSATLETTIGAVQSPTEVALQSRAASSVSRGPVIYATDDTAHLQNAYNAALDSGRPLYIPAGNYLHHGLNWTGQGTGRALTIIRGDAYRGTNLWALAVTNPGATQAHRYSVGVDLSVASETTIREIAFFGGWNTDAANFADLAPQVNVFCGRRANGGAGGNALSILHTWDNVYTETQGAYDVVWDGCEQSDFIDSHAQVDGDHPTAALYLTNVNTPGFASPYVGIIAQGPENTMTKFSMSGARSSIVGKGNLVVLDEGASNGIFQLSFRDLYVNMSEPGDHGSCNFLSDTAANNKSYIRTVALDHVYIEGPGSGCKFVNLTGQAVQWYITGAEHYPAQLTNPDFAFNGGFYASYLQADSLHVYGKDTPVISAPSCMGSILQLGPMNTNPPGCKDYAFFANTTQYVAGYLSSGSTTRAYPFRGSGQTSPAWVKLGTWKAAGAGDTIHLTVNSTGGEQSRSGQQGFVEIAAAVGNTAAAPNITGISGWIFGAGHGNSPIVEKGGLRIAAHDGSTAANNLSWDLWAEVQPYAFGSYGVVVSDNARWTSSLSPGDPPEGEYVVQGTLATVANDEGGQVTLSSGTATLNLSQSYRSAPVCVCSDTASTPQACSAMATGGGLAWTLRLHGNGSDTLNYICRGQD